MSNTKNSSHKWELKRFYQHTTELLRFITDPEYNNLDYRDKIKYDRILETGEDDDDFIPQSPTRRNFDMSQAHDIEHQEEAFEGKLLDNPSFGGFKGGDAGGAGATYDLNKAPDLKSWDNDINYNDTPTRLDNDNDNNSSSSSNDNDSYSSSDSSLSSDD